jgi:hypothetical protein
MRRLIALFLAGCGGTSAVPDASDASVPIDAPDEVMQDVAPMSMDAGDPTVVISDKGTGGWETETQIAVAPDGTIGVAWTGFDPQPPYYWMGYRFSSDGGKTWSPIGTVATLPNGLLPGDPAITVDAQGNFWLSLLGIAFQNQTVAYTHVYVAKATQGTTTFGAPVAAAGANEFFDHPKILALADGSLLVLVGQVGMVNPRGVALRSKDGITWSESTIITPAMGGFANLFWACQSVGRVYTTYWEYDTMGGLFAAVRSSDDYGATWTPTSVHASAPTPILAGSDPSCVATGSDLWVEYGTTDKLSPNPDSVMDKLTHVFVAHSGDRGATFDPTRQQAADLSAAKYFLHPVLVQEPTGAEDIVYYAGNSQGDIAGTLRWSHAADGTSMFGASTVLSGPLEYTAIRTMSDWLGDYIGVAVGKGFLDTSFATNGTGSSHIAFRRIALP